MRFLKHPYTIILAITTLLFGEQAYCFTLSGRVTSADGTGLPFVNVYISGTTNGTTTNTEGYYRLEIPSVTAEAVFRYVGFKTRNEKVTSSGNPVTLDVILEKEKYTLAEVNIRGEAEDPAYGIMRKAIAKRKQYLKEVDSYSCEVYIKGIQKITKYPEKLFGVKLQMEEFMDTVSGIAYLSESVSKYSFSRPDKIREQMISSKVSGNNRAFSFNQASEMNINFYENIVNAGNISPRGFISPVSASAMLYYNFRLDGTYLENDIWINRIEVIPKRKADPVFSGFIYIQDGSWRIHSTDFLLTKDAQIQFVDSLRISQVYIPAGKNKKVWMPGSVTYTFSFGAFGFKGNGSFVGVYSQYNTEPEFSRDYFKNAVLKIEEGSNKKDSIYWEGTRPVPLTPEESRDYTVRDSMQSVHESKPYLDSLDHESNKFKFSSLLTGYQYINRYRKRNYTLSGFIDNLQFNSVEGLNIGLETGTSKTPESRLNREYKAQIRYGFSNYRWSGNVMYRRVFDVKNFGSWTAEGGSDLVQFNGSNPISPINNTSYTLVDGRNFMKLYEKSYGKFGVKYEVINGVRIAASAEYSNRNAVYNTTNYSFVTKDKLHYTSNNPIDTAGPERFFPKNNALKWNAGIKIRFRQQYIDRPDMKYILGSKFPVFSAEMTLATPMNKSIDADYLLLKFGLEDRLPLGMLGSLYYSVNYGNFLSAHKLYFMDYAHFNGNRTIFSEFTSNRFDLLDYYSHSTADQFITAFAEQSFGGFILNKIPVIRKLKLNEVAGVRFLHVPGYKDHLEISAGVEKLGIIRADFVLAFDGGGKSRTGFVLGLKRTFGP